MPDPPPARVLIVDDHQLFAEVIRTTLLGLGMAVLPVATSAEDGLAAALRERPDLVLMDVGLGEHSGLTYGRKILDELPRTKVVALTANLDRRDVRESQRLGFKGYLVKDTSIKQFAAQIEAVLGGRVVLPGPGERVGPGSDPSFRDRAVLVHRLTPRERDILALLAKGAGSADIARELGLSPNTIRTHVQNILTKLQVHSRLEAATFAVRHGLIQL
jgi:DNA-binding NarL/FixJ family response regulator